MDATDALLGGRPERPVSDTAVPFSVEPNASNHFAWMRTVMALQRTHMAAVRTAVSLIGFGFTVAQFFERLLGKAPEGVRHMGPNGPRNIGLVLIAAGVGSLLIFTFQFNRMIAYMRSAPFQSIAGSPRVSLTGPNYLIAYTVMAIGVAAFASVFLRF
jgi:putative membrane protein